MWYNLTMRICSRPGCGNDITHKDKRQMYCSRSCSATVTNSLKPKRQKIARPRSIRKTNLQKWLDGEWSGDTKHGLSSSIRKYLIEEADFTCQDGRSGCNGWRGFNEKSGLSCLTVDHLNGNPSDHRRENLKVMCPNCHSMTPTYGALNKGNGRKHRYASVV